jgi:serine/threonine-protein kinase
MINQEGQIKLMDFGIAKNMEVTSADYTQTGTNQNMGTPMYMSPEQIKSTRDVTLQSDVYSLGVVLWQMVTGQKPYNTQTLSTYELQTKIVNEELPSTSSIFDIIIRKSTAKNLDERFENCSVFKNHFANPQKQDKESTKVYNSQNSEKTIVENNNDRTIIDFSKNDDPFLCKPIFEKTSIPMQKKKSESSSLLNVILLFFFIFFTGLIVFIALIW